MKSKNSYPKSKNDFDYDFKYDCFKIESEWFYSWKFYEKNNNYKHILLRHEK